MREGGSSVDPRRNTRGEAWAGYALYCFLDEIRFLLQCCFPKWHQRSIAPASELSGRMVFTPGLHVRSCVHGTAQRQLNF